MIGDTNTRIYQVKKRLRKYRRQKEKRFIYVMTLISLMLTISITKSLGRITNSFDGGENNESTSGAMLLHNEVGGYILMAVLAFVAGVVFTIICVKKARDDKNKNLK